MWDMDLGMEYVLIKSYRLHKIYIKNFTLKCILHFHVVLMYKVNDFFVSIASINWMSGFYCDHKAMLTQCIENYKKIFNIEGKPYWWVTQCCIDVNTVYDFNVLSPKIWDVYVNIEKRRARASSNLPKRYWVWMICIKTYIHMLNTICEKSNVFEYTLLH